MNRCQSCHFFLINDDKQGLCRRFPPTAVATPEGTFAIFPPMLHEGWCGEHLEKESNK
ncbi:MAG: hypothetical protein U0989_02465 [Azonexus sp.]|nr:hypothetical protein [Azonexus sp.]MDZ4313629.1 hypothetical protein [Azonexus sp.]